MPEPPYTEAPPRIIPPFGPGISGDTGQPTPTPGTPAWTAWVRRFLLLWDREYTDDPAVYARMMPLLDEIRIQDPSSFQTIYNELFGKEGSPETSEDQLLQSVLDYLNSGGGGGYATNYYNRNIQENIVQYVDVPTAEEFLDDFRTAFYGQINTLREAGKLQMKEVSWLQQNWDIFASEYTGELAQRAQQGQELFKTVGLGGTPVQIGTRPGEQSTATTALTPVGQTGEGAGVTPMETPPLTTDVLNQTETLMQRQKLALVSALSPTDWFNQTYPVERLQLMYAKEPSMAGRYTGGLGQYGQPRRVSG